MGEDALASSSSCSCCARYWAGVCLAMRAQCSSSRCSSGRLACERGETVQSTVPQIPPISPSPAPCRALYRAAAPPVQPSFAPNLLQAGGAGQAAAFPLGSCLPSPGGHPWVPTRCSVPGVAGLLGWDTHTHTWHPAGFGHVLARAQLQPSPPASWQGLQSIIPQPARPSLPPCPRSTRPGDPDEPPAHLAPVGHGWELPVHPPTVSVPPNPDTAAPRITQSSKNEGAETPFCPGAPAASSGFLFRELNCSQTPICRTR